MAVCVSRSVNGVSRRHGEVARVMWQGCWPGRAAHDVPITHVTHGVHAPTWVRHRLRELLDERLGAGWLERADDPTTWAPIRDMPDEELWGARNDARRRLIDHVRVARPAIVSAAGKTSATPRRPSTGSIRRS